MRIGRAGAACVRDVAALLDVRSRRAVQGAGDPETNKCARARARAGECRARGGPCMHAKEPMQANANKCARARASRARVPEQPAAPPDTTRPRRQPLQDRRAGSRLPHGSSRSRRRRLPAARRSSRPRSPTPPAWGAPGEGSRRATAAGRVCRPATATGQLLRSRLSAAGLFGMRACTRIAIAPSRPPPGHVESVAAHLSQFCNLEIYNKSPDLSCTGPPDASPRPPRPALSRCPLRPARRRTFHGRSGGRRGGVPSSWASRALAAARLRRAERKALLRPALPT